MLLEFGMPEPDRYAPAVVGKSGSPSDACHERGPRSIHRNPRGRGGADASQIGGIVYGASGFQAHRERVGTADADARQ